MGDYSECVSEMATDVVHLSFLVRGDVPTVNSRFTTITADVSVCATQSLLRIQYCCSGSTYVNVFAQTLLYIMCSRWYKQLEES